MMYYIKDSSGHRWKVKQAVSVKAACAAIAMARATGSIGSIDTVDDTHCGGTLRVIANVVRVHSDYSEQKAYEVLR